MQLFDRMPCNIQMPSSVHHLMLHIRGEPAVLPHALMLLSALAPVCPGTQHGDSAASSSFRARCVQFDELKAASFSEEMRLVYVAMTRAREHLYLTVMPTFNRFGKGQLECKPADWIKLLSKRPDLCQV